MKTNVSENSIRTYRTIGKKIADQDMAVLMAMTPGFTYSRRELGILAGIENSAAARSVNGLVKSGALVEAGVKRCVITKRLVGGVMLAVTECG
jgi:hypothetical protein